MEVAAKVLLPGKKSFVAGTAALAETDFVFYKRDMFIAIMFGALGSLLAGKKEYLRIHVKDVKSVKEDQYKNKKRVCYLTLNDGQTYVIVFGHPDKTMAYLQQLTSKPE